MINPLAFLEGIGGGELMMIMFIILILFGSNRLPELAKGLGKSMREFKKATSGVENELRRAMEEEPPSPPKKAQPVTTIPNTQSAAVQSPAPTSSATPGSSAPTLPAPPLAPPSDLAD